MFRLALILFNAIELSIMFGASKGIVKKNQKMFDKCLLISYEYAIFKHMVFLSFIFML